ncbi:ATP-binding protein [Desulfosporosinus sp. PR]|uniref:GAF domain-containing sensor histidine kinase n=1 Tax=Candidatus Desulfosporosinus nitrosoreducens TaxID=3401928 RepID=UPI0027E7568D|nr:ATP-binding protein [Desulfosporosinus sp. PR]MDQ7097051.1 ATP-binding protein [Desulfosporosinus sp. PR]
MKAENSQLNQRVYQALIKLNNFMGFFPNNLEANLALLVKELEKLLAPCQADFCLRQRNFTALFGEVPFSGERYTLCQSEGCWIEDHVLPIIVQDLSAEEGCRNHLVPPGIQSYAGIPIMEENEVIGVLTLHHPQKDFFTREILEVLLVMANLAAIAIHQWRLVTRLEREKTELQEANREIKELARNLAQSVDELKKTQKQLIQLEKLASAGRLATDIAHEINNPVGIIVSSVECMLLDGGPALSEEFRNDARVILDQTDRISKITRSLLSFARQPVEEKSAVNLNQIIEETVGLFSKHLGKKGISVHQDLQKDLPLILGNSNQVQQILVNLISNAGDAMSQGGNLYLRTKFRGRKLLVEVEDEGCGLAPEQLEKIFDPFYTTKGKGVGTGLGLAISYSLIEEHGGEIDVASKEGEGTCFTIAFPAGELVS